MYVYTIKISLECTAVIIKKKMIQFFFAGSVIMLLQNGSEFLFVNFKKKLNYFS